MPYFLLSALLFSPVLALANCALDPSDFSAVLGQELAEPYRDPPKDTWGPWVRTVDPGDALAACLRTPGWAERRAVASAEHWVARKPNYCHHHVVTWVPRHAAGAGWPPPNDASRPAVCTFAPAPDGRPIRWNYSGTGDETAEAWRHEKGKGWGGNFSRGVDCSDFTSFVFNWGFGLRFTSAVARQGGQDAQDEGQRQMAPAMPGFRDWRGGDVRGFGAAGRLVCADGSVDDGSRCAGHGGYVSVFDADGAFHAGAVTDAMLDALRPGDLIFVAGLASRSRAVTHVVLWTGRKVGAGVAPEKIAPQTLLGYGYGGCSPDAWRPEKNVGTYAIIDSHYQGPDWRAFTPCFYRSQVWGVRRVLSPST